MKQAYIARQTNNPEDYFIGSTVDLKN